MLSVRPFLIRGLLAGLLAGIFAFGVAYVVGEPIDAAIAIEESAAHTHPEARPRAQPRRGGDRGAPLAAVHRRPAHRDRCRRHHARRAGRGAQRPGPRPLRWARTRDSTLLVTGIGFVSLYAVPFVAYPPNPPAVGDPDTIGTRTALYFTLVAISLVAAVAAVLVGRRLAVRWGAWYAGLAAVGGYLLIMLIAAALLPAYNEVPADFPASVLYEFRAGQLRHPAHARGRSSGSCWPSWCTAGPSLAAAAAADAASWPDCPAEVITPPSAPGSRRRPSTPRRPGQAPRRARPA